MNGGGSGGAQQAARGRADLSHALCVTLAAILLKSYTEACTHALYYLARTGSLQGALSLCRLLVHALPKSTRRREITAPGSGGTQSMGWARHLPSCNREAASLEVYGGPLAAADAAVSWQQRRMPGHQLGLACTAAQHAI
jgi:hypothetical protein